MNYLDSEIEEVLLRYYNNVRKVSAGLQNINVIRKGEVKRSLFGILPIYEYNEEQLNNWTPFKYTSRNRFTGLLYENKDIYICFDEVDDICYWKYYV